MRKSEIVPFAATWTLSEASQSEKDGYDMCSLMWILRNFTEDLGGGEGEKTVTKGEGGRQTRRDP